MKQIIDTPKIVDQVPVQETSAQDMPTLSKIILTAVITAALNALCSAGVFCPTEELTLEIGKVIYKFDTMALINILSMGAIIVFRKYFLSSTKMPKWTAKLLLPVFDLLTKRKK